MTVLELKEEVKYTRDFKLKERKCEIEKELYDDSCKKIKEAKEIIFSNMHKRKALAIWDYVSTFETQVEIALQRHYSERTLKRFIDEANELISAL